jgi:luciferase family oxidoreductase group 1
VSLPLSILDVSPVGSGFTPRQALLNTIDLAQLADQLGYARYWLAEHHNTPGIASSVPELMIGQVAAATTRLRVGAGGMMLPNHSPLKVAECFRLLEALFPARIDLGLGRAPGTDQLTALALRRSRAALTADDFPEQVDELLGFLGNSFAEDHPFRQINAVPRGLATPQLWILGSSDYGARYAARHGLGFAFAHHINPAGAVEMLRLYRAHFQPSPALSAPRAILGVSVVCADTDAHAEEVASSVDLAWLRMEQGRRDVFPSIAEATAYPYTPAERERIRANRARHQVGGPKTIRQRLTKLADQAQADELMVLSLIHDHENRRRSYALLAEAFGLGASPQASSRSLAG